MSLKTKFYSELFKASFSIPMEIEYWNGDKDIIGNGNPEAFVKINEPLNWKEVTKDASIALGEAYMDKKIEVDGNIQNIMLSAFKNADSFVESPQFKLLKPFQKHDKKKTEEDIQYHYDIGNDFYRYWLDESMTYSCAYFHKREDSLELAQEQKIDHILKKLRLNKGEKLLDIGCGWGNLIIQAAKEYGVEASGCTLSEEQADFINQKVKEYDLEDKVNVRLMDYRDLSKTKEKFDKIVSVGMFEHVGKEHIQQYISEVKDLMKDGGLALIHGISNQRDIDDETKGYNGFLNKYIFPGGYIPSIGELVVAINKEKLKLIDFESLRPHYQYTLEEWHKRYIESWDEISKFKDERFMRMWDIYLQSCAAVFQSGNLDVCQYLIEKGLDTNKPLTRAYML